MFERYNYFRQHNGGEDIADYKSFYRKFSNEREFGGSFSNLDHLVKLRFCDFFGHVYAAVLRRRPDSVIDVGCGNGAYLPLSNMFPTVDYHGLDYAERTAERAQKDYPHATVHVGDAFAMPFEPKRFDMAILSSVLILYKERQDQVRLLREVSRVLKDDGVFVLVVWNDCWGLRGAIRLSRLLGSVKGEQLPEDFMGVHFTEEEIRDRAAAAGLVVQEHIATSREYGILEAVRHLNFAKYNRTFGSAERESVLQHPQNVLDDLVQQAGDDSAILTKVLYQASKAFPDAFPMFSVYVLGKGNGAV